MFPYLLNLQECYTQYSFLNVLPLKNTYSIRLYELLRSYMNMDSVIIMSLDDLRERIGCDQYPRFSNFNQRVLTPILDEINEYTDIDVEYKLVKVNNSRKYNRIQFYISNKLERKYTEYLYEKIKRERLGIT
jgi:plasmid replication initiation protein